MAAGAGNSEKALLKPDLTISVAGRTRRRTGSFLCPTAFAFGAGLIAGHLDLAVHPKRRLFETDLEVISKIGSALDAVAAASATAEHIAKAKQVSKNVTEIGEN
jgi:hypothetical protein